MWRYSDRLGAELEYFVVTITGVVCAENREPPLPQGRINIVSFEGRLVGVFARGSVEGQAKQEALLLRLSRSLLLFLLGSIRAQLLAHHNAPPPRLNPDRAPPRPLLLLLFSPQGFLFRQIRVYEFLVAAILQRCTV